MEHEPINSSSSSSRAEAEEDEQEDEVYDVGPMQSSDEESDDVAENDSLIGGSSDEDASGSGVEYEIGMTQVASAAQKGRQSIARQEAPLETPVSALGDVLDSALFRCADGVFLTKEQREELVRSGGDRALLGDRSAMVLRIFDDVPMVANTGPVTPETLALARRTAHAGESAQHATTTVSRERRVERTQRAFTGLLAAAMIEANGGSAASGLPLMHGPTAQHTKTLASDLCAFADGGPDLLYRLLTASTSEIAITDCNPRDTTIPSCCISNGRSDTVCIESIASPNS